MSDQVVQAERGPMRDFQDPNQEWMMGEAFPNTITRSAAVVAPELMGVILFMGKVSGAHLNKPAQD